MPRRIVPRFLDAARTRAEVTIVHFPSWLGRLFGERSWKQTTIAVYGEYKPSPRDLPHLTESGWLHEVDRSLITDDEIQHTLEWKRRWDTTNVGELPRARLVEEDAS